MTRILVALSAAVALAVGGSPLLGGTVPRDCGDLRVDPAQPRVGLAQEGVYDVISFSRDDQVAAPTCRRAMRWSRGYLAEGDVPKGFKVKAIRGATGRAFLRIGNEDVGFRMLLKQ